MKTMTRGLLSLLLITAMCLPYLPTAMASVRLEETELNKLVGAYATTANPETQSAIFPEAQIANQASSYTLDAQPGFVSLDFGVAANVRRLELTAAATGSRLTGEDYEIWLGTENFGKIYFGSTVPEKRAQTARLSPQDYSFRAETRDGKTVHVFTFKHNAAARYLIVRQTKSYSPAAFVLANLGRDVRAFGSYAVTGDDFARTTAVSVPVATDFLEDDTGGTGSFSQLGAGAFTALDTPGASLALDMGGSMAVKSLLLRASDEAAAVDEISFALFVSDDGNLYRRHGRIATEQAVTDGRRTLRVTALSDAGNPITLIGRYFKLSYIGETGAGAFRILNPRQDIQAAYDPFGLPGSDPFRRNIYNGAVSVAYFDSRFLGEYGQAALDKRNELSVEAFIPWYLDNLNNNFNYLYRWDNLGESYAADNQNISTAIKLPSELPVNNVTVIGTRTLPSRVNVADWRISYSTDTRNFTVIDPSEIEGEMVTENGMPAFLLRFPEIQASTILVYNVYAKNGVPVGSDYFPVKSDASSFKAGLTVPADGLFYAPPTAVTARGAEALSEQSRNRMLLDIGETAVPRSFVLPVSDGAAPSDADFALSYYDQTTGDFLPLTGWTVTAGEGVHLFTLPEGTILTRYLLVQAADGAYFDRLAGSATVNVDPYALPGVSRIIPRNPDGRGGFVQSASGLPSLSKPAAQIWAEITAEATPEAMFATALANGVSIGWAYRVKSAYALDDASLRESAMLWWNNGAMTVSRVVLTAANANDTRITADDFYVSTSTDGLNFTPVDRATLTVTQDILDEGNHRFTLDFPGVSVSHVMIYSKYSLGELEALPAGKNYFAALPTADNMALYNVIPDDYTVPVTPTAKLLAHNETPLGGDPITRSRLIFDRQHLSLGLANSGGKPISRIMLLGAGEGVPVSASASDYRLWVSDDNESFQPVTFFNVSVASSNGKTQLNFDVNRLTAPYIKLQYVGSTGDSFLLADPDTDILAFTLTEKSMVDTMYRHAAMIGYADNDRLPASGTGARFGSNEAFDFDWNLRSLVADLGENRPVNYIKLFDLDGENRLAAQDLSIWLSDDNIHYEKVKDFTLRRTGNAYHLYNFEGTARYVKVHQTHFETNSAISGLQAFDSFATFTGPNLQQMMEVYTMPLFSKTSQPNVFPYGQGQWSDYKDISLRSDNGAMDTGLAYLSYEELGIPALVAHGKLRADFADVRFADTAGRLLPTYDDGSGFFVRLSAIPATGAQIVFYFGNPLAQSVSDGMQTLQVDFGGRTISFANFGMGDTKAAMLADGRMMIANHGWHAEGAPREVQVAFSADNGQTFGAYQRVTFNGNDAMDGLLALPSGEVMLTYTWFEKDGGYGHYTDADLTNFQVYAMISKNGVTEWNEPVKIDTGHAYNLATSNPILASDGSIYVPVMSMISDHGAGGISLMRSADGGQTWTNVTGIVTSDFQGFEAGFSEPAVVELRPGVLRVYYRQGADESINKLGEITSYDNGETWTEPGQSPFYATATQPALYRTESGRIFLMWAGHNGTGSHTYQRMPITMVYSDDGGESWQGYQEISGRMLLNLPFGSPQAMQPDFSIAPDGSLYVMIWMRGTIYSSSGNGAWIAFRMEDFDRWVTENTGAFDDFEQPSAVKGNYWYEIGPSVGVSDLRAASGLRALRVSDTSPIDNAMAVRNFMGVHKGEIRFSLNFHSADSGLRLGLWESLPSYPNNAGLMFEMDVDKVGALSMRLPDGSLTPTGVTLTRDAWHTFSLRFDVAAASLALYVDGKLAAQLPAVEQMSVIAYFAAYSMSAAETGTEFYLDNFMVIDGKDASLRLATSTTPTGPTGPTGPGQAEPNKPTKPTEPTTPGMKPEPPVTAPDAPAKMTDTAGHWGKNAIDYVVGRGLFTGITETTFSPDTEMTRAMVWTVLARLDGQTTKGGERWYALAQAWAKENGISDGALPNGNVTREQLVTMLHRYHGAPAASHDLSGFKDANRVSGWASDAVQWAVQNDLLVGYNGALNPQHNITRAEVATILMRFIKLTRS